MTSDLLRMPSPDDVSDEDFQKAVSDALDEHDKYGLPREDIPKNFGVSKPSFEKWAKGNPPQQATRKAVIQEIEEWRRKQRGLRD